MENNKKRAYVATPIEPIQRAGENHWIDLQEGLPENLRVCITLYDEEEIKTKYCPAEYYKLEDGVFTLIDEDDWFDSLEDEVYEELDPDAAKEAHQNDDEEYFTNADNFERKLIGDVYYSTKEIVDFWDGSNWQEILLYHDDYPTEGTRDEDWENGKWVQIWSSYIGQGQGHDEYYRVILPDGKEVITYRPVSYWQGDMNNEYYPVNINQLPDEVKAEIQEN